MRECAIAVEFTGTCFQMVFAQFRFILGIVGRPRRYLILIDDNHWTAGNFREGCITR